MPDALNFEALNQGAVAVPNAATDAINKWDSLNQNAKVADAMVRANPDLEQRMGMPEGAFSTLSAQDKIAATTGYIKNQGVQEFQAKMADYQAQANQRQQNVQDDQTAGTFVQNYFNAPTTTTDPDGTVRPTSQQERMAYASGNTPGMSGKILPRAIDSISKWNATQNPPEGPTTYSEDPVTGFRTAIHDRTILPSGVDPKFLQGGPQVSSDGKSMFNGKIWVSLKQAGFPDGSVIKTDKDSGVNYVADKDGKMLKIIGPQTSQQALASVLNGGDNSPAPEKTWSDDIGKQYLVKYGSVPAARAALVKDGYTIPPQ